MPSDRGQSNVSSLSVPIPPPPPYPTSRLLPLDRKLTLPPFQTPAYQVFYEWVCGRCGYVNTWGRQLQCVNIDCMHAYCERDCRVLRHYVRVEGSGTSSRRS